MKRITWIAVGLIVLSAVVILANTPSPTKAVAPDIAPIKSNTTEYLIALPMPDPDTLDVPASLPPERVTEYARRLTYKLAQPILSELERLRAQGKITDISVRPDLHAIAVKVALSAETAALTHLADFGYMVPAAEPADCIANSGKALVEQVQALSAMPHRTELHTSKSGGIGATSLIDVYAPPDSTYTYVTGKTTSNTSVQIRLLRGSSVLATATRTTNSGGYYSFYPTYQSCPTYGYNWTLRPGDVVEVTVGTNAPVSTTVVNISAWADPATNVVAGTTASGRSILVELNHYPNDYCSSSAYDQTVTTDTSGAFSANFTAQVDFNRRGSAVVYARDANGNSTYAWFYAYRISAYFAYSDFWGYLKPNIDFTATLSRTGSIISTVTGKSSARGYYDGYFSDNIQSGDVIAVNGGGVSMKYTATSLTNATLNPATDQATGKTGPGQRVEAYFYKNDYTWPLGTTCSYNDSCTSITSDGSGNFTLNAGFDLVRGDYAYLVVFDAEGNYQYSDQHNAPAISANLSWGEVGGYWRTPDAYLTIILKNSSDTVKGTDTASVDSYDNSFYAYPGTIVPTDKIEVGDGVVTETMTVQNLTSRLRSSNGHLTGAAYNGHLLAWLWDFRRETNSWYGYCSETGVSGGAYDLTFTGAQVGAQDYSDVWATGSDGHYTWQEPNAFSVNTQKESNDVWGESETPLASITVTLKTGATTKAVYTTTSDSGGYYYGYLTSGVPVTITQGDIVMVQTGDGNSASVAIPDLTVNKDTGNNQVYGRSPANEPVQAQVRRQSDQYSSYHSRSSNAIADASGNYSVSFNGLYWSRDCSAVQVGHRCVWPIVYYYNSAGHLVRVEGTQPPPVSADLYESDNISTTASLYTGVQHHTFDAVDDTDWITFTVSPADASNGVPYHIETFNLGWGMDTELSLYDTDGTTLLAYNDDSGAGLASTIEWTPSAPGIYYVEVTPFSSSSTGYCDAVYDLIIMAERSKVYLPVVLR
jgi:hypothetical protein